MFGRPNSQLAYETPVRAGSLPRIIEDPEPQKPPRPEVADHIEWFKAQFARSRFDQDWYNSRVSVVTPQSPEILTTIDFVRDYPQPELIPSLLKQITASQSNLADYQLQLNDAGWPARNPFNPVTSPYTGLPALIAAGVEPFDPNADAAAQQASGWLMRNAPVITGLEHLADDELRLTQVQGFPIADQPADIVHVNFQQRFRDYPVYGAQVALHMATSGDAGTQRPTYVTSSYFPIPDIQFTPAIEPQAAIAAAEQALAAYLSGPDALQPLGEALASSAGQELADGLANFAVARSAALQARDALAARFADADPTLNDRGLPGLLHRAWNQQEGQVSIEPAWWNRPSFPTDLPDTTQIGDLLAPPQWTHRDLLPIVPPSLRSWIGQPASAAPPTVFQQLQEYDWERQQATRALTQVQKWLVVNDVSADIAPSLAAVTGSWAELGEPGSSTWDAHIARYEESELLVLPYAGRYYLAYLVELLTPSRDEGWRVFVNAESGAANDESRIIGRPESMSMHFDMRYYASSQAVLDATHTAMTDAEITAADDGLLDLAQLKFHPDAGGAAFTLQSLKNASGLAFGHHQAGMNIAFHAHRFLSFFQEQCGVAPNDLLQWYRASGQKGLPLTIQAGQGGDTLTTGFVPSVATLDGTVTFQTASINGLTAEGSKVHNPSLDPELIYHEMAHALMWLLHRAPFDSRHDSVPFGRALLEGYANYLARSLAARSDPSPGAGQWARASYRDANWHQRWDVAVPAVESSATPQPRSKIGLRLLPVPNIYPEVSTAGLAVYDVGMIWTRALWDIRTYLSQQADVGANAEARIALADRLVMQSYRCVQGWSASFETAAEGLIAAARITLGQLAALTPVRQKQIVKEIQERFIGRGILAERGIQAIGQVTAGGNTRWLAGADSGLRVSADPKLLWDQWKAITAVGAAPLPGVTDLFVDGASVYIATEQGIYQWDAAAGGHAAVPVGNPMAGQTPRCLAVVAGQPVAGTNYTLWRFDENQQAWSQWKPAGGLELKLAASQIMTATVGGQDFCLVAALDHMRCAKLGGGGAAAPDWKSPTLKNSAGVEAKPGWITSCCVVGTTLYMATAYQGVWPVQLSIVDGNLKATAGAALPVSPPPPPPPPPLKDPGMGKVLRLINDGNQKLYAGTTTGLFEINLLPAVGAWARVAGSAESAVTVVLPIGGAVAAGTAAGGLWVRQPTAGGGTEVANVETDVV